MHTMLPCRPGKGRCGLTTTGERTGVRESLKCSEMVMRLVLAQELGSMCLMFLRVRWFLRLCR